MRVTFKNSKTGELKEVKVGWSWTLFFFSGFFGLPLFLRRLYIWGFVFLALWVVNFIGPSMVRRDQSLGISVMMFFIFLGLQIWLGVRGNEMTAKNYLEEGWRIAEPNSEAARLARRRWGIPLEDDTATATT